MENVKTATLPLTLGNLPKHPLYEADGSCWQAIKWPSEPRGWRWQPMNWKAFAKEEPEGETTEFPPGGINLPGWQPNLGPPPISKYSSYRPLYPLP